MRQFVNFLLLSTVLWPSCIRIDCCPNIRYRAQICESPQHSEYALSPSIMIIVDHPLSANAPYGSTVVFNCSAGPQLLSLTGTRITWRFNGSLSNGSSFSFNEQGQVSSYPPHWSVNTHELYSELVVTNTSSADDGYYECVVGDGVHVVSSEQGVWRAATETVSKRAWLNSPIYTGHGQAPELGLEHQDRLVLKGFKGDQAFNRNCTVAGPNETVYWYKDGRNITEHYNSSTGELCYSVQSDLYGVYQCFVENSAGSDSAIFRVFERKFANPPSNFSCRAVDQENDQQKPKLIATWDPPSLVVGDFKEYVVKVNDDDCYTVDSDRLCMEIPLEEDASVQCSVYLFTEDSSVVGGVATVPKFSTNIQRRYVQESVRLLNASCPLSDSGNITVSLPTPEIIVDETACLFSLRLWGMCLFGNRSEQASIDEEAFFSDILMCDSEEPFTLSLGSQPPGTVCLFGGEYEFPTSPLLVVPPVACGVPVPEGEDLLSVTCSELQATVSWKGQRPANLSGKCYFPDESMMTFEPMLLSPSEVFTVSNLSLHSICTFYLTDQPSSPVQCIAGGNITKIPTPAPPTNEVTTNRNGTSENVTMASGGVQKVPVYIWVILSIFVSSLFPVALVSVCLVSCYRRRYQRQREKKELHFLATVVEQQLDNPHYPPVDPFAGVPTFHSSSFSLHTELDSLHASRIMLNEHTPVSLLDGFFSSRDTGDRSDESKATTPSEQMVELVVTSTEQYLQSSGSSSGYGTTHSVDGREYYEQRLADVTDPPHDRTHYVREYFEPDLEGYVHMVPYKAPVLSIR